MDDSGEVRGGQALTVLGALDTVFRIAQDVTLSRAAMCKSCAEVLSHIYTYYVNLVELSQPSAPICNIVRQFKNHFQANSGSAEFITGYDSDETMEVKSSADPLSLDMDTPAGAGVRNPKKRSSVGKSSSKNAKRTKKSPVSETKPPGKRGRKSKSKEKEGKNI